MAQVEVPDADDMDDETFLKHVEKRHAGQMRVENGKVSRHAINAWIGAYRAFHEVIHDHPERYGEQDHEHTWED